MLISYNRCSVSGGVLMDEYIRMVKQQAYHKGYLAGYQRGIEDSRTGRIDGQGASELLDQPIQFLNLSVRPFNSLDRAGYQTIREIIALSHQEIWKIRNLGAKGRHEIATALWEHGVRDSEWNEWLCSVKCKKNV